MEGKRVDLPPGCIYPGVTENRRRYIVLHNIKVKMLRNKRSKKREISNVTNT